MSNGNNIPQYFENPNPHRFNNLNPHHFNNPNLQEFNHPNPHYVDNRHFVFNIAPNSMDPEAQMKTQIQIQAPMHAQHNHMPMLIQGNGSMQSENNNTHPMYDSTLPPHNYGQTYNDPVAKYQDPIDEFTNLSGDMFESSYPDPLTGLNGGGSAPPPYMDENPSMNGLTIPHQAVFSTQYPTSIPLPNLSPQMSDSSFPSDDTKGSFSSPQVDYTSSVTMPMGDMSNAGPYASPNVDPNIGMNIGTKVSPGVINPIGLHAGPNVNHNSGINVGPYVGPTVGLNQRNVRGFVYYVPTQSHAADYQTPPLSPQIQSQSQSRTTSSPSTTPSTPVSKKRGRPRANITPEERTAQKLKGNREAAQRCREKAKRENEALRQMCERLERTVEAQRQLIQRYEEERVARGWDE